MDNGQIVKFWEKPKNPPTNMAIIGIYYISSQNELSEAIEYLMENNIRTYNEYQLTDAFSVMLDNGHYFEVLEVEDCLDCGIPATLLSTNHILLERKNGNDIHDSAVIHNSHLSHCTVSENCHIKNSELQNVIMLKGSKLSNQKIENTILGCNEIFENEASRTIKN